MLVEFACRQHAAFQMREDGEANAAVKRLRQPFDENAPVNVTL
jgi:hypothetical protein